MNLSNLRHLLTHPGINVPGCARRCARACLLLLCLSPLATAHAQSDSEEATSDSFSETEVDGNKLSPEEAARVLALALPEAPEALYPALQRQFEAARWLEDRPRMIELAKKLIHAGRGRPGGEAWIRTYLSAEFNWGSSGAALQACEPFIDDGSLSIDTRAAVALRQAYFTAQGRDRAILHRIWSRADELVSQALKQGAAAPQRLEIDRLQVRSEVERWRGDNATAVATLRQAVAIAQRELAAAKKKSLGNARDPAVLDAHGWLDGSMGMLTYALVRQGRAQEAIDVSNANLALWRAGEISDGQGARWNYRLATSLNATQQYPAALAAARLSDEMLQRSGSSAASQTRWLARQEVVRGLIGQKHWPEADAAYREFLASMPPDVLARTRASDWRLLALLAAKNGRFDEAIEGVERIHRFRTRLYGSHHPQTQEAAGLRAVVRLLRGDMRGALSDYEALFAATLDNPGGWLDLDLRGVRGYVFGVAFDEFMHYVATRALKGEPVDTALSDRALQIADRNNLGVTQRALTDSTARVLATTPALRALIEQEQTRRQSTAALVAKLSASLGQDDQLRRQTQTEAFKALPDAERKAHAERQKAVREQIKVQQTEINAARAALTTQREGIASQFPGYADLVTPTTPRPDQLRKLLGAGEALLLIHPTDSATLTWLIGADGSNAFAASPLTRSELFERVAGLREMLDLGAAEPGREPTLKPERLHVLYRELLTPLEPALRDVRSLIVATQGPLASLPLAALVTSATPDNTAPAWLVRRMAVTQIPSPSALLALRRVAQPQVAAKALLGFGDPVFQVATRGETAKPVSATAANRPLKLLATNPGTGASRYEVDAGFRYLNMPPLPETRNELLAVAAALGADAASDLVLGAQATRQAVVSANLLDRRVVAFATHGLMPGELPGVSRPSLAMAASADMRESPLLELDDVLGLRLNAQWVLLSACNTAAGEQGGGAMSGLVRAFFFAGARSVLATHWAVESASAAALSSTTFKAHAQGAVTRGESLRLAQLAMIDGQLGAGRWTHPFYWAPYALFGDPLR